MRNLLLTLLVKRCSQQMSGGTMFRYRRTDIALTCDTKLTITPCFIHVPLQFHPPETWNFQCWIILLSPRVYIYFSVLRRKDKCCIAIKLLILHVTPIYARYHILRNNSSASRGFAFSRGNTSRIQRNFQVHTWSEWWTSFSIIVSNDTSDVPHNAREYFTSTPSFTQKPTWIFKGKNNDSANSLFPTFARVLLAR